MNGNRSNSAREAGAGLAVRTAGAVFLPLRRVRAVRLRRRLIRQGECASVRPCATLVVAPHPDDETIGCGGVIALKRLAGGTVSIVVLTDGSDFRGRDPAASAARIADTRRREALAAAAVLGVPAGDVHFLDLADGRLAALAGGPRDAVVRRLVDLLAATRPDEVYVTDRRDGHPDHEAAYRLVADAVRQACPAAAVLQYPIWSTWAVSGWFRGRLSDRPAVRVVPIHAVRELKARALAAYHSQLATLPPGFLKGFELPYEIFSAEAAV